MIKLYTDGSSRGNPGPGGYAAILTHAGREKVLVGGYRHTTNNRMELLAVIIGLEALKGAPHRVEVYTDSRYVVNPIQKGWLAKWRAVDFKKKKNSDLWRRFMRVYAQHDVTMRWVQGHAGHAMNERCDTLAFNRALKGPWQVDEIYMGEHGADR
ncbi:MAG: ribonuclease HI [Cytophagales bacterium]